MPVVFINWDALFIISNKNKRVVLSLNPFLSALLTKLQHAYDDCLTIYPVIPENLQSARSKNEVRLEGKFFSLESLYSRMDYQLQDLINFFFIFLPVNEHNQTIYTQETLESAGIEIESEAQCFIIGVNSHDVVRSNMQFLQLYRAGEMDIVDRRRFHNKWSKNDELYVDVDIDDTLALVNLSHKQRDLVLNHYVASQIPSFFTKEKWVRSNRQHILQTLLLQGKILDKISKKSEESLRVIQGQVLFYMRQNFRGLSKGNLADLARSLAELKQTLNNFKSGFCKLKQSIEESLHQLELSKDHYLSTETILETLNKKYGISLKMNETSFANVQYTQEDKVRFILPLLEQFEALYRKNPKKVPHYLLYEDDEDIIMRLRKAAQKFSFKISIIRVHYAGNFCQFKLNQALDQLTSCDSFSPTTPSPIEP